MLAIPKLVLASNNAGKLIELQSLLSGLGVSLHPQSEFDIPDAEETGLSFIENAILKARHASRLSGLPALADDSGLAVDALDGAPGIYSARYAGEHGNDSANNQKLITQLSGMKDEQRGARFHCVLALVRHPLDPVPIVCEGTWEGRILSAPVGEHGFGYDPLFWVEQYGCSSAQLEKAEKNKISHRGQALRKLLAALLST